MVVVGDAATHNEKEVKRRYPVTKGLTAGTESQEGRTTNLVPQESLLKKRETKGLT